ncbi:MAG: polymer-forming cytoskeletal protein [Gammaproteobacteria bacterium]|nr:polymer-forming cytoskeletal protein [Gammaproteobacteria bacterium]
MTNRRNRTSTSSKPIDVSGKTMIGEAIKIVGNITGKEDIIINGTVEGEVDFRDHFVVVGNSGQVNANISAKSIRVDGTVKGILRATEEVNILPTGKVTGDIRAPRMILDEGSQFKGSVDTEEISRMDSRTSKLQLAGPGLRKN